MDDHGAGSIHSGPTDLQHNGTVSLSEISNDARLAAHNKLISRQNNLDTTSQQKDLANERTPKASAASLPAASMPVVPNHTPERPVIQNMSVTSNSNTSAGYTSPINSAVAIRSGGDAAPSNATPFVTVEPSSPVTNPVDSRSLVTSSSLTIVNEGHAPGSQSNLDRRASRRRSAMEQPPNHRFSGFFSNLLHLRERDNNLPMVGNTTSAPPRPPSPPPRVSVGFRTAPPAEPRPPPLAAPSLQELGLSLSVLTRDLSPHLFTTPISGTFLSPHYLLLCHSQGLDVCPLVSPPAIQPYALVRRVAFKSVVVMEERGVLVAIAGRRDGVRVYALEEIRKAVEWRIEVELRRELEKHRREEVKKPSISSKPPTPDKTKYKKKNASVDSLAASAKTATSAKTTTSSATTGKIKRSRSRSNAQPPPVPLLPPSFPPPRLVPRTSVANLHIHRQANSRARAMSAAEAMGPQIRDNEDEDQGRDVEKGAWMDVRHSDDEVLVAAGPSGSAALDERTSAISAAAAAAAVATVTQETSPQPSSPNALTRNPSRRNRPSNLDLSGVNELGQRPTPTSPAPTLMTIRQALTQSPRTAETMLSDPDVDNEPGTPNGEVISFAEALLESRLPDAPPLGQASPHPARAAVVTRFPLSSRTVPNQSNPPSSFMDQVLRNNQSTGAISGLVDAAEGSDQDGESEGDPAASRAPSRSGGSVRAIERRNRWSVLDGVFRPSATNQGSARPAHESREESASVPGMALTRTMSDATTREISETRSSGHRNTLSQPTTNPNPNPNINTSNSYHQRGSSGFSRIFNFPKRSKRRDRASSMSHSNADHSPIPAILGTPEHKGPFSGLTSSTSLPPLAPPPKLEYVKLPGTKGAVMIKAVETARKSFLAILCGDAGEKVELFAGTYRTALGLSRTFILPDSPKTLELQLQGDDLVEVFLVFSQNVFGLEPATVRVREVRIGRAERRAARRRAARENNRLLLEDNPPELYGPAADEDAAMPSIIGHSEVGHDQGPNQSRRPNTGGSEQRSNTLNLLTGNSAPSSAVATSFPPESGSLTPLGPPATPHPDEVATAALIAMGPYTTFQQLSFAPPFPLATLADECIIPPTYTAVEDYKKRFEISDESEEPQDGSSQAEEAQPHEVQWYYKDPRGVVRGPWAPSLMQSWFKDNFLPADLPVRRGTETEYISLRELQRQSIDPESPFRPPPPGLSIPRLMVGPLRPDGVNPLLHPISLLTQEKRLGPPALFYSSRGGHSTSIVDARGRSVLKGRLHWTPDDATPQTIFSPAKLGDVKRLEAFEIADGKTVLVAFRQGGLEATDIGDAVMTPGDDCRTVYPYFEPPPSLCNRRSVFTWRTGEPVVERVPDIDDGQSSFPSPSAIPVSTVGVGVNHPKRRSGHVSQLSGAKGPTWKTGAFSDGEDDNGFYGIQEDLLVLGRSQDKVYFCDRSTGKFRLMMLSTQPNTISNSTSSNPTSTSTSPIHAS